MGELQTQLLVLGGGPGGYPAAFEAADHGMQVTLVDEGVRPGGVCLNRGCIPSKALLHVAKMINETRESSAIARALSTQSNGRIRLPPAIRLYRMARWMVAGSSLSGGVRRFNSLSISFC